MENTFLVHAFLFGIVITCVYDMLRIFRRVFPHGNFMISLEDFLFWIYCGVEVFLLMYHESNGVLRWFAVLGAIAGMLLYSRTVSPLLVKYVSFLLKKVFDLLWKVFCFLGKPFCFLLGIIGRKWRLLQGKIRLRRGKMLEGGSRRLKKKLTYLREVLKM